MNIKKGYAVDVIKYLKCQTYHKSYLVIRCYMTFSLDVS